MAREPGPLKEKLSGTHRVTVNSYENWQSLLSDDIKLNDIALAGTHNSAASHFSILPGLRCQGTNITHQLQNGIRFLDLRIGKRPGLKFASFNELYAVHGFFSVKTAGKLRLVDILSTIYEFLEGHSSEFLVISLKEEGSGTWLKDEFSQLVLQHVESQDYSKYWMKNCITKTLPTVAECRGHCILLRRFSSMLPFPLGIDATNWPYNSLLHQCSDILSIQDFCEVNSKSTIQQKQQAIDQIIKASVQNRDQNSPGLYINFVSSTGLLNPKYWPSNVSKKRAKTIVDSTKKAKLSGIIVFDFADLENFSLVHHIVMSNF